MAESDTTALVRKAWEAASKQRAAPTRRRGRPARGTQQRRTTPTRRSGLTRFTYWDNEYFNVEFGVHADAASAQLTAEVETAVRADWIDARVLKLAERLGKSRRPARRVYSRSELAALLQAERERLAKVALPPWASINNADFEQHLRRDLRALRSPWVVRRLERWAHDGDNKRVHAAIDVWLSGVGCIDHGLADTIRRDQWIFAALVWARRAGIRGALGRASSWLATHGRYVGRTTITGVQNKYDAQCVKWRSEHTHLCTNADGTPRSEAQSALAFARALSRMWHHYTRTAE